MVRLCTSSVCNRSVKLLMATVISSRRLMERYSSYAARYGELLKGTPATVPIACPENKPVYHLYVIRVPRRDELQAWLKSRGVFTGIHYPVPVHLQNAMGLLDYKAGDLPMTERVAGEILSLPMYAELTDEEIEYIADSIKDFYTAKLSGRSAVSDREPV